MLIIEYPHVRVVQVILHYYTLRKQQLIDTLCAV